MEPLSTPAIAELLREIGQRLEIMGESPFKVRAYYNAADSLVALTENLGDLIGRGRLKTIPGVGEAIAEKIIKLYRTGTHPTLEDLRSQIPAGVLELLKIPGLGPKKAAQLYDTLKIDSLAALEAACRQGKIRTVKGMSEKSELKMLQAIELVRRHAGSCHIDAAEERMNAALVRLPQLHSTWKQLAPAGPFRRRCEVVDELVLAASDSKDETVDVEGFRVRVGTPENYGITLLMATGSEEHIAELTAYAKSKGLTLSEAGLAKGSKKIFCTSEEAVYAGLGLPVIPPELREGRGEVALAAAGKLPALVEDRDIRGILHSHTLSSDGAQTLNQMADAVMKRGYQYYGVSDHSQSAGYAGGMKEDKIKAQHKLADDLNAKYPAEKFRIFKGVESDIREDGALDYDDTILQTFDFIVSSIHSRMTLDAEAQTRRLIAAASNPYTTIMGHLSGRKLLGREGYKFDVEEVLKVCARHGVVVEINANPNRLDLEWRYHQKALELGCMLAINPDAHSIDEIDLTRFGVMVARKGGVPKEKVLNCMDLAAFSAFLKERQQQRKKR